MPEKLIARSLETGKGATQYSSPRDMLHGRYTELVDERMMKKELEMTLPKEVMIATRQQKWRLWLSKLS